MGSGTCIDCGYGPLDLRSCWHEVIGFERDRAQGGTNALADRKRTGKILCGGCVQRRKSGIAPEQGRLA